MEKEAVARSWDALTNLQLSPASLPPYWSPQKGDNTQLLHFTGDRHYFMHGEIIAFTAISIFVIFLLFLIVPCIRRATSSTSAQDSDSGNKKNCLQLVLTRKRRYELQEEASIALEPRDEKNYYYGVHQHS